MSLFPSRRVTEASAQQVIATGAAGGAWPGDEPGWRRIGGDQGREVPQVTRDKARTHSVAAYRSNPLARAVIDTHVAFAVGDSGVSLVADPVVRPVVEEFWSDSYNRMAASQELRLRSHLLLGESLYELMVGGATGVVRMKPIDPTRVRSVESRDGNPEWPEAVLVEVGGGQVPVRLTVAQPDDLTELLGGEAAWWTSFKALETDVRGFPFLAPIQDWLDSYDLVLSNLIDRTALARYLVWDVTLDGADSDRIKEWVKERGGIHAPRSGTVEVHNEAVRWDAKTADTGSYEDTNTARSVMTLIAAGSGLSKVWLAEPEDANRATSLTMAEPVRRRISAVQNTWLARQTELARFAVDQAVKVRRLEPSITVRSETGEDVMVSPSSTVHVTGPQIAAADAQVTAKVLVELAKGLTELVSAGLMSVDAAKVASRRAWEQYVGSPYRPELDAPDVEVDEVANATDGADGPLLKALKTIA